MEINQERVILLKEQEDDPVVTSVIELLEEQDDDTLRRILADYLGWQVMQLLTILEARDPDIKAAVDNCIAADSKTIISTIIDLLECNGVVMDGEWHVVKDKLMEQLDEYKLGLDMNFDISAWEGPIEDN